MNQEHPYVTLTYFDGVWTPTRVDQHPNGYEQASATRPGSSDRSEAKRDAVAWANSQGVPYKLDVS